MKLNIALPRRRTSFEQKQALTFTLSLALGGVQGGVNALPSQSCRYECWSIKHLYSGVSGHAQLLAAQTGSLMHPHSLPVYELLETNTLRTTMNEVV